MIRIGAICPKKFNLEGFGWTPLLYIHRVRIGDELDLLVDDTFR